MAQLNIASTFPSTNINPAASSKRGVLFILLLGFILQSVVLAATPFFEYYSPTMEQYLFLGFACLLLFCIKLLYVDDSFSIDPQDHALLVNRAAGFFFHFGQFFLLVSTTVLGAGLDDLTHNYLAATAALSDNSKNLVCGGFSAVVLIIAFIKSMHIRRVPNDPGKRNWFIAAYTVQVIFLFAVIFTTAQMCLAKDGPLRYLMMSEIEMLAVLSGFAFLLVVMSWLDEAVELSIYGDSEDAREFRVHPFGIWFCFQPEEPDLAELAQEGPGGSGPNSAERKLAALSPLLGSSVVNLGYSSMDLYQDGGNGSARNLMMTPSSSADAGEMA